MKSYGFKLQQTNQCKTVPEPHNFHKKAQKDGDIEMHKQNDHSNRTRMIWIVWKGWALFGCILVEIGFSRFGYEWGFFACFHASHAFMSVTTTIAGCIRAGPNQAQFNGIVTHPTVCQVLANAWALDSTTKMINDFTTIWSEHEWEWARATMFMQQRLIKSENCSKSLYGVYLCDVIRHRARCTSNTHLASLCCCLWCTGHASGFIGKYVRWL